MFSVLGKHFDTAHTNGTLRTETKVAGGLAVAGAAATLGTGIYAISQKGKNYAADSIAAAGIAATGIGYMSAYRMAKTDAGAPPKPSMHAVPPK